MYHLYCGKYCPQFDPNLIDHQVPQDTLMLRCLFPLSGPVMPLYLQVYQQLDPLCPWKVAGTQLHWTLSCRLILSKWCSQSSGFVVSGSNLVVYWLSSGIVRMSAPTYHRGLWQVVITNIKPEKTETEKKFTLYCSVSVAKVIGQIQIASPVRFRC